jgi:hypothetical protein
MQTTNLNSPYAEGYQLCLAMRDSYETQLAPYPTGSPESIEFWRGFRDASQYVNCVDTNE